MKDESHNKQYTWRTRVKELDIITHRRHSTEENKIRLRQRLDQSRKQKHIRRYCMAAACLMILLLLSPIPRLPHNDFHYTTVPKTAEMTFMKNKAHDPGTHLILNSTVPDAVVQLRSKTRVPLRKDSLTDVISENNDQQQAAEQKPPTVSVVQPEKGNSSYEHAGLPVVYLNDIIGKKQGGENITLQSLSVQRMIRLFSTDPVSQTTNNKLQKIPDTGNTNSNDQN